jgi:PPK2 family polyphosphate:nucleotide phosphotransferase
VEAISDLQQVLWADGRHALLVILQGLDTAGKDGAIRHVFTGVNPQGCRVTAFRQPSLVEQEHDYLWRVHAATPGRGQIGIFNRSHYEDVAIVRVKGLVPERVWRRRYRQINEFERHLVENGTTILKFFLHISRAEQRRRLLARIRDPRKNWKMSEADLRERESWDRYMAAYEEAIHRCGTTHAPWYVIPADHKWYRNVAISRIVADTMRGMGLRLPPPVADLSRLTVPK